MLKVIQWTLQIVTMNLTQVTLLIVIVVRHSTLLIVLIV